MKKITLLGLGNKALTKKTIRFFFTIKKNKIMLEFLAKFLLECGFKDNEFKYFLDFEVHDPKNKSILEAENCQKNYKNKFYDIDVVHCKDSVILLVRTTSQKKHEFVKNMFLENSKVVKPKKQKKRKK